MLILLGLLEGWLFESVLRLVVTGCVIEMFRLRVNRRCAVPVSLLLPTSMVDSAGPNQKAVCPASSMCIGAYASPKTLWGSGNAVDPY
jgi:hypothetical protein